MHSQEEHSSILKKLISSVQTFGWHVIMLEATDYFPSFAYTVGLWKTHRHPEIILFGLKIETLHLILNDAGEMIKGGAVLEPGKVYDDFFTNTSVQFVKVDKGNLEDYFGTAMNFYTPEEFPAIEMVWTDRNNVFPWDNGFEEEFRMKQPLLDRNLEFKYIERPDLGVFTTKQWLEEGKPILRVVHDTDGDWQFLTGDQKFEDARLVCLQDVVGRDLTLNDVFNLDYGESADREEVGGKWVRSRSTE